MGAGQSLSITFGYIFEGVVLGASNKQKCVVCELRVRRSKGKLRSDRAHIVPAGSDWVFESDYEPKWPETFLPSHNA